MRSVILYCPALKRDISKLQQTVPNVFVHEGKYVPHTYVGSTQGHKAIVAEAKALGEDSVFVMEDDCEFTEHFSYSRWLDRIAWAKENRYDVLVGGSTRTYEEKTVKRFVDGSALVEVSAFHSSHCVVYLSSCFDKMELGVDPIDLSMGRDCGARCVVAYPFVAVQRPSFSGVNQQDVDYVPLYNAHEHRIGAFVNGLVMAQ